MLHKPVEEYAHTARRESQQGKWQCVCLWEWDAESVWEGAWLEWQRVAVLIIVMVLNPPPPNDAHRD